LPLIHKIGHPVAFDTQGKSFIGGAALLTLGCRGQTGRSARQQECADGHWVVQRGIEGQTAAHRVAEPVSGPGGAAFQHRHQISGDARYRVASGIGRGVAAAVAGQVNGEHAEAHRQPRPEVAPRRRAAGEAVK